MKTLIMKAVLPCLALLVLVSGKPFEKELPGHFIKTYTIEKVRTLPTTFNFMNSDGGNCLNPGARMLGVNWSGGTLNSIRLDVVSGFTITSSNPLSGSSGSAWWSINVNPTGQVIWHIYGKETANSSWTYLKTGCFKACAEPEECE